MRIYLITLFLIIADFQIKYYYALGLDINKVETRTNQPDLNGTFDGHPESMNANFPGFEDLAIISELDGASRLEPNSLELRQSQGCNDNYPASSDCPSWANVGYCSQSYGQWMAQNCKKSCNLCGNSDSVCFQKGLFVEGSIPMGMTFKECEDTCEKIECCKFITWFDPSTVGESNPNPNPNNIGRCGIRCFETTASIYAPGQIASKKTSNEMQALSTENSVYVAQCYLASTQTQCHDQCRSDPQCNTVFFFDSGPNNGRCVLNYGPTLDKLTKIPGSDNLGYTAPRDCP